MNCTETRDLISAYYDNELSAETRAEMDAHIQQCAECEAEIVEFKKLSSLTAGLDRPETPASVWSAVEQSLANREGKAPAEPFHRAPQTIKTKNANQEFRPIFKFAAAIAAVIIIGFVGFVLWPNGGNRDHHEMAKAMEQIAADLDADDARTLLLNKFGGKVISYDDALTEVGYQPIASRGLPPGYTVESVQVLDMPCCKCIQTTCRRSDNSRVFIYEHGNEDTGWFQNRNKRRSECSGKTCQVVQLEDKLAVTWQTGNRHITLLGVRDEEELELLVSQFENRS